MSQYGILNDILGTRSGVPHTKLPKALMSSESRWVHYWRNAVRRMPGRSTALEGVQTPDGNPIINHFRHVSLAGTEYLFVFTKAHIYWWDQSNEEFDVMFTCASDCTRWSVADMGQFIVATNDIDKVQYWDDDSPSSLFTNLGGANGIEYATGKFLTKAKYVIRHYNYIHLLSTTEDGTSYPYVDRWSDLGDVESWDQDGAGDANYRDLDKSVSIRGAGIYEVQGANQLIVFTDSLINAAYLTEDNNVYASSNILVGTGCLSDKSIVKTPDGHLWYLSLEVMSGTVDVRRVYDPNSYSYDISPTLTSMHPTLRDFACGAYVGLYKEIWWCVPGDNDSTANDTVLSISAITIGWNPIATMDIQSFGFYTQQTNTYINDLTDFINDLTDPINSYGSVAGNPIILASDADGYTWSLASGVQDKGVDYTGELVLASDFGQGQLINRNKRLHGMYVFLETKQGTSYTVTASVREGDVGEYTNIGNITLNGNGKTVRGYIRYNTRLRDGHFKFAATNDFDFLGVVFDFDITGVRL